MNNSRNQQILSVYSLQRSKKIRQFISNRQKKKRIIISNYLQLMTSQITAFERIIEIYNPPERSERIFRPIDVGIDLLEKLNEARFSAAFRISKENFRYLCEALRPDLEPKFNPLSINHRKASVEEKVAICLYKLKSRAEYSVIANVFGFSPASVCIYVYSVIRSIVKRLTPLHIKMPTATEARVISEEFRKISGIPQIIGCIDGTHIPVLAPQDGHKDYLNRKGWTSIVCQGVVDNKCRFLDICCKFPGSVHDAQVFKASALYRRQKDIFPKSDYFINEVNIPFLLIGDPAYPALPWLLKDYPGGGLNPVQSHYNLMLNRARVKVEQAYGMLKIFFRILGAQSEINVDFMPLVVAACCTLYNIIYDDLEHSSNSEREEEEVNENDEISTATAETVRDTIANFLS